MLAGCVGNQYIDEYTLFGEKFGNSEKKWQY